MKVAILIDNTICCDSPYPRRIVYTAKTLMKKGHDVTIFCKNNYDETLKKEDIFEGIKVKRVFKYYLGTTELIDKYIESHIELFQNIKERFDVYHCIDTMTWPIGYLLSKRDSARFICECLEYFPDYIPKEWHKNNMRKYELTRRLIYARGKYIEYADNVIVVSEEMKERLSSEFNLKSKPIVIYNTRSKEDFNNETVLDIREELNIEINKKIILFQGIVEESRGIEYIIRAIKEIDNVVLVIAGVGDKEYIEKLKKLCSEIEVDTRVIFTGFKKSQELFEYTLSADYLIYLPKPVVENINITIPNKFFDYLLSGKPVIFSDILSMRNIINKYNCGMIIKLNDIEKGDFSELKKYFLDVNLQHQHVKNLNKIKEMFWWEKKENELLSIYK